ncbi:GrpB family protein [Hymenobacter volaticus]|uniref:GrpB family protein n=1 Tax=Hymenobacter volaticus TaxID=2932254 RepID=A0ABY4GEC1_9BACT|nr:GrpB family protein [Hymenobacter volaticus]UOQ69140.1 GrpB family protein [Hymenobacter volaticus]
MKRDTRIVIEAYNPRWSSTYEELKLLYQASLQDLLLAVEHVGSTSVVGLAAKPILDIDLVVADEAAMQKVISKLALIGYQHQGDLGIVGREAFKLNSANTPYSAFQREWPAHHLYACLTGSTPLRNHLLFRDYLRTHRAKVSEYGQLKKQLATLYPTNIPEYVAGKTAFITTCLKQAGISQDEVDQIIRQNNVP